MARPSPRQTLAQALGVEARWAVLFALHRAIGSFGGGSDDSGSNGASEDNGSNGTPEGEEVHARPPPPPLFSLPLTLLY